MTAAESVAALEKALASGVLTVDIDGARKTYRSAQELREAIAYFRGKARAEESASRARMIATPDATVAVFVND